MSNLQYARYSIFLLWFVGHLVLKLRKLKYHKPVLRKTKPKEREIHPIEPPGQSNRREYLEVTNTKSEMDFSKIVDISRNGFEDNAEVPMLEYA